MKRAFAAAVFFAALAGVMPAGAADERKRVEVVAVRGIVDAHVERSVRTALKDAARDRAALVVLEIDSRGTLGAGRAQRIARDVAASRIPVATWVAPPGARAQDGAALIAQSGHVRAMAPGTAMGPLRSLDLRRDTGSDGAVEAAGDVLERGGRPASAASALTQAQSADAAERRQLADLIVIQLPDLLRELKGKAVRTAAGQVTVGVGPSNASVRFRKGDLLGRALHGVSQPSIVYLLLLLGLIGVVFELFHPSSGPAGVSGLLSIALAVYGLVVLGGSWLGAGLLVGGVVAMCVDLRFQSLGVFTLAGAAGLVAGSVLLFRSPALRVNPWVLAVGIASMIAFLIGAMTRVLRDLRAVAAGEMEVVDPVEEIQRRSGEGGELES